MKSSKFIQSVALCALTVVGVSNVAAGPASTGNPAAHSFALAFLRAVHNDDKMKKGTEALARGFVSSIKRSNPKVSDAVLDKCRTSFLNRMKIVNSKIEELQIQVLMRHYSAQELKEMAAFYGSPAGQHFQTEQAKTMGEITSERQQLITDAQTQAYNEVMKPKVGH